MTTRNKILLSSSIILALLVIVSVYMWGLSSTYQVERNSIQIIFVVGIVLVSISSVFIVYFTKIQKKKFEKLLKGSYFEQYEIIRDSIANSQLSVFSKRDVIEDVLELLLTAQESGKPVDSVIQDAESFTQDIIQTFAKPSHLTILSLYDSLIAFILMVVGASLVMWLEATQTNFFAIKLDISMVFFFLIVVFFIIPVTKGQAGTRNPWIFMLPIAGGVLFVLVAEILRAFFYDVNGVKIFLDGSVRMVPSVEILMVYLLSIPLFLILKQFSRKKMLLR